MNPTDRDAVSVWEKWWFIIPVKFVLLLAVFGLLRGCGGS